MEGDAGNVHSTAKQLSHSFEAEGSLISNLYSLHYILYSYSLLLCECVTGKCRIRVPVMTSISVSGLSKRLAPAFE